MSTQLAPAVELNGLSKRFGAQNSSRVVNAVNGIDLTVQAGEIVAFLGPNGAGKTTALDMLLGLSEPTGGTVRVLGQTPSSAVAAGRLAAVLQTGGLLHDMRVGETVRAVAAMHRVTSRVQEVMERADLTGIARRSVGKCSGGEQQRIKFALALLPDPDVLVLDEPTAGMDVGARRRFWDAMRMDADQGRTVIFATHYLEEAEQFARRTVLVAHGKVVADAPTEQLRASLGGRTLSCSLPEQGREAAMELLGATSGIADVSLDGHRVTLRAADSDAVARLLLNELGATDLEIVAATLEAAFTNLTED
ncbi:ABC transporter ATP-binding protein [Galactobacter caseinivorans]|uniref:ABC transporter ATP-binding protein n=1 Tax=Galactobacter caseinivorans TaxID=2676123 RepID=A0A496PHZ3_9MICC|nr:ABC transporter ATP-binding protein [Galactobacter caseinivorans]RKW70099.1 ABC transporter ATP-binding protein [Galactobacter caseinivorans]